MANIDLTNSLDCRGFTQQLKQRYAKDVIYSSIGDVLVVVNPMKLLMIYTKEASDAYKSLANGKNVMPHVFGFSQDVFNTLVNKEGNALQEQCIVMRGESGSGKTETMKKVVQYFTSPTSIPSHLRVAQILTVLEAFGNARTELNDNSSRFGCFLRLHFRGNEVVGAKVKEFLFEKHRVTQDLGVQSNFNVFYYWLASQGHTNPSTYRYLASQYTTPVYADMHMLKSKYQAVVSAMDVIGFTEQECSDVFLILSAILMIGNITLEESVNKQVCFTNEARCLAENVADIIGVNSLELEECISSHVKWVSNEQVRRIYTRHEAENCRDVISRLLYSRLFSWIIFNLNRLLVAEHVSAIGILDMFGFEILHNNGFSQLVINLVEEQLRQFSMCLIHKGVDREEMVLEGIDWTDGIIFADSQSVIDLCLAKPLGILTILDQQSQQTDDIVLRDNLVQSLRSKSNFISDTRPDCFTIKHYSGPAVTYCVNGWLQRNQDVLTSSMTSLFQSAENNLISVMFKAKFSQTATMRISKSRSAKTPVALQRSWTLSTYCQNTLKKLTSVLSTQNLRFIFCIRPNCMKGSSAFDDQHVLSQVECFGLAQLAHIETKGSIVAFTPEQFIDRYRLMIDRSCHHPDNDLKLCTQILEATGLSGWKIGKTKIFLTSHHVNSIHEFIQRWIANGCQQLSAMSLGTCETSHNGTPSATSASQQDTISTSQYPTGEVSNQHNGVTQQPHPKLPPPPYRSLYPQLGSEVIPESYTSPLQQHTSHHAASSIQQTLGVPVQNHAMPNQSMSIQSNTLPAQYTSVTPSLAHASSAVAALSSDTPVDNDCTLSATTRQYVAPSTANGLDIADNSTATSLASNVAEVNISANNETARDGSDLEDDFIELHDNSIYGPIGSHKASVCWFKATQAKSLRQKNGSYSPWFHGIISRKEAERLLREKPVGCFLIRVGESRIGYTLSINDESRCRHYMIEEVRSQSFRVTGERTVHTSLSDLVEYYKKNKLLNWDKLLTVPCTQIDGECNYLELLVSAEEENEILASIFNRSRIEASAPGIYRLEKSEQVPVSQPCFTGPSYFSLPTHSSTTRMNPGVGNSAVFDSASLPRSTASRLSSEAPPLPAPRRSSGPALPPRRQ